MSIPIPPPVVSMKFDVPAAGWDEDGPALGYGPGVEAVDELATENDGVAAALPSAKKSVGENASGLL